MRIFKEEQRFNQTWLIILLLMSVLIPLVIILVTYVKDPSTFTSTDLAITIGTIVLASGIIFIFKLTTRIDQDGIHYKFFPFHFKFKIISWSEISTARVRTYDAITEYGGWGLKGGALWNKAKGTAINVSGNIGIQLQLKNGKKLLIGTQKEEDAKSILTTYKSKIDD